MSGGIIPTRIARARELLASASSVGAVTGDDVDWDTSPVGGSPDQWKQPVACATTAAITIATALNAGDVIDGVTLAEGDRVLVKDQGTTSQNGIWIAGATPARAPDMDQDAEVVGAVVLVVGGLQALTIWNATNTTPPVVGTDAITWATVLGAAGNPPGYEYDYVENTGTVTITATTAATAQAIVTGNAVTYDGSTVVMIEVFIPDWLINGTAADEAEVCLYDGASELGNFGLIAASVTGVALRGPFHATRRLTPSAGAHTCSANGWKSNGGSTVLANIGDGASGNMMPAFIRITKV